MATIDDSSPNGFMQSLAALISRYFQPKKNEPVPEQRAGFLLGMDKIRAISMSNLSEQVWNALMSVVNADEEDWYWPVDLYMDRGQVYLITTKLGRLYRMDVSILDDRITLGEPMEVVESFIPQMNRSRSVFRQKDGRVRVLTVVASSVLNRSGEIDSRELFDSFVDYWQATGENPVMNFSHDRRIRLGEADYVAREEYCLIYSYVFDDTEIGRAAGEGYLANPDYWGHSIEFEPFAGEMVEIAPDIYVPVYTRGVNAGCALLPEHKAAALFTNNTVLRGEIMNEALRADLAKLVGDELADEFAGKLDRTNEAIVQGNLIARSTTDDTAVADSDVVDAAAGDTADLVIETEEDEEEVAVEAELSAEYEFVMDDDTAAVLADHVLASEGIRALADNLARLTATVDQLTKRLNEHSQTAVRELRQANDRLANLERQEEAKQQEWLSDLPRQRSTRNMVNVTYRPSVHRSPENDSGTSNGKAPSAAVAEATLSVLPTPKR